MIIMEMSTKHFYILGFDLTPDREADEQHVSLTLQRNCLSGHTIKTTSEPVTCIFYAEFPADVEIDHYRNVTLQLMPFKFIKF